MEKKLYKCICHPSDFTEEGEILIGYFKNDEQEYFLGTTFLWYKDQWTGSDSIFLTKAEFKKVVKEYKEI